MVVDYPSWSWNTTSMLRCRSSSFHQPAVNSSRHLADAIFYSDVKHLFRIPAFRYGTRHVLSYRYYLARDEIEKVRLTKCGLPAFGVCIDEGLGRPWYGYDGYLLLSGLSVQLSVCTCSGQYRSKSKGDLPLLFK